MNNVCIFQVDRTIEDIEQIDNSAGEKVKYRQQRGVK